ncbi:MAG: betaine/proline/choline family ABC transporter ATP-binding protein, partial [Erysipelothrix sp.]|nr:betaine/proline/choline family ABC transporter ATP-binding protein [Erysipelothrix sp.]
MINFNNVSMSYGDNLIIKNMNLHIPKGELVVLIGPSGCGKTTSLQLMNRLIDPDSGTIEIDGKDIHKVNVIDLRRQIGYVIQEIGLFPHMTIRQNIEIVPKLLKWDEKKRLARTQELMKIVGLNPEEFMDRYPAKMSGGQQQRIGFLRALAADPPIILLDEPFGALDPVTRDSLQDELKRLQKELNKTMVFVTHDMDEAIKIADRIVIMNEGQIVQYDTPEEILLNPANQFVEKF